MKIIYKQILTVRELGVPLRLQQPTSVQRPDGVVWRGSRTGRPTISNIEKLWQTMYIERRHNRKWAVAFIRNHHSPSGKITAQEWEFEKITFLSMPGSTKEEREIYEQYIIESFEESNPPVPLLNSVNPMGGRMDKYRSQINAIIFKYQLPRYGK